MTMYGDYNGNESYGRETVIVTVFARTAVSQVDNNIIYEFIFIIQSHGAYL